MKLIVISNPTNLPREHDLIHALFEAGLQYFHLRKPGMEEGDYRKFIDTIDKKYHDRIIIHDYYHLVDEYLLSGVHGKLIATEDLLLTKSASIHEPSEVKEKCGVFDYVFLSPLFDSISKKGYMSKLNHDAIDLFLHYGRPAGCPKIIALGGIDLDEVEKVQQLGFDGLAILGALWVPFSEGEELTTITKHFRKIKNKCLQLSAHMF